MIKKKIIAVAAAVIILVALVFSGNTATAEHKYWHPGISDLTNLINSTQREIYSSAQGNSTQPDKNQVHNLPVEPLSPGKKQGSAGEKTRHNQNVNKDPQNDEHYIKALELIRSRKLQKAEGELLLHVKEYAGHSQGWRQLGDCRYNLGKVRDALGAYRIALRADRGNYLALRGKGVAALYIGYELWEKGKGRAAHEYFKTALQSLHSCAQLDKDDELASYARALAAEGVSRELYRIAKDSLDSEYHTQAKRVIRNCLEIIDSAIEATEQRLQSRKTDIDAQMLLGGLHLRRARLLQPFGHIKEALSNLQQAQKYFGMVAGVQGKRQDSAKEQVDICKSLSDEWLH